MCVVQGEEDVRSPTLVKRPDADQSETDEIDDKEGVDETSFRKLRPPLPGVRVP